MSKTYDMQNLKKKYQHMFCVYTALVRHVHIRIVLCREICRSHAIFQSAFDLQDSYKKETAN